MCVLRGLCVCFGKIETKVFDEDKISIWKKYVNKTIPLDPES